MIPTVHRLRVDLANLEVEVESIHRIVDSDKFEEAYNQAPEPEKEKAYGYIKSGAKSLLREWILRHLKLRSYADLKLRARQLAIPCWSRMNKSRLTLEVEACEHAREQHRNIGASVDSVRRTETSSD